MEKVFVFGGSGLSGKVLLKYLSKMNVEVVAATRNPEKVQSYPNVKWFKAYPKQKSTYIENLKGCSAVLSVVGTDDRKNVDIYSKGYQQIVRAMEQAGVYRLIFVTASHDHPDLPWIFQHFIRPAFMNKVFEDMERQDAWFKKYTGPVQFTNLRPMKFTDGKRNPAKEKHTLAYSKESVGWTFQINTEYLAEVIIECWKKNLYINQFVDLGSCK